MADRYAVRIAKDGKFWHVLDCKRVMYVKSFTDQAQAEELAAKLNAAARPAA